MRKAYLSNRNSDNINSKANIYALSAYYLRSIWEQASREQVLPVGRLVPQGSRGKVLSCAGWWFPQTR